MIISAKIRGFICTTAHPLGCAAHVEKQISHARSTPPIKNGPRATLIIGASTGYGLASRIAAAFGAGSATIGVFFEREAEQGRTATAGWYNTAAFESQAKSAGLYARSFNGDAFSDGIKSIVTEAIRRDLGQIDLVIYSLASPRRTHPRTGKTYSSVLKPIGASYTNKNLNTTTGIISPITIEPASEEEIAHTVAVMGGEDWEMWIDALLAANALAPAARTLAFSYIGPEFTWPIYKNGTIGRAKAHLELTQQNLDKKLAPIGGKAWISVNKALVTQASSAIPVVPLYISLLYKAMKENGSHEECAEQMTRLFHTHLCSPAGPSTDESGRIRMDDWEMAPDIQAKVARRWELVETSNLSELADLDGYRSAFLQLFGFNMPDIDYSADVNPWVPIPSLKN